MSGTCDALEFMAHTHIRDRAFRVGRVKEVKLRTPMYRARPRTPLHVSALLAFFAHWLFFVANSEGGGAFFGPYRIRHKSREAEQERLR